jgi:hypothetical protein
LARIVTLSLSACAERDAGINDPGYNMNEQHRNIVTDIENAGVGSKKKRPKKRTQPAFQ